MWPFPKKKEIKKVEPDWRVKALAECMAFRAKGETFKYMGIEMLVTDHGTFEFYSLIGAWTRPNIHANYINKQGEVKSITFEYEELKTLREQNAT